MIGGFQPSVEKDSSGQDIIVEKLVESNSEVRFNTFNSKIYADIPQLNVVLKHVKHEIKIPENIYCQKGGYSTPVVIDIGLIKPIISFTMKV